MSDKVAPSEPREPAAREGAFEGPAFEWLQKNGYKELGQPIHYEHDGHVGYRYPHEILAAYSAELRAERDALKEEVVDWGKEYQESRKEWVQVAINWQIDTCSAVGSECLPKDKLIARLKELLAAERSLLQARAELIPAVQSLLEWMPKYSIGSSGYMRQERGMKALLASTSALEGDDTK